MGFTVIMQNSDCILTSGFPLTQNLTSVLTYITSSVCMCECIHSRAGVWRKTMSLLLLMLKTMDALVKTSLRISEHSKMLFAFPQTACSRTQQALLSTCPHTHLSLDDIGGRLLILSEPILPSPKASNTVLRAFCMINGKLEKNMGEAHQSPIK